MAIWRRIPVSPKLPTTATQGSRVDRLGDDRVSYLLGAHVGHEPVHRQAYDRRGSEVDPRTQSVARGLDGEHEILVGLVEVETDLARGLLRGSRLRCCGGLGLGFGRWRGLRSLVLASLFCGQTDDGVRRLVRRQVA